MAEKRRFINNTDIGQNFLIDESVVAYTVKRAAVTPDDVILEIGPGGGILTRGLLSAGPRALYAVEVDERLRDGLEALASRDGRLRLFWGDAVRFDYRSELPETPTKIVANLPYHITTPILWTFLEKLIPAGVGYMLLMVQLESAERIASPERSRARSPLGVTVEAMGGAEILRKVPPQAFRPQPRVNSALIEIKIDKNRELANDRTWRALLARSFTQRRKTLVNNWTACYADIDRERALAILDAHGLSATARAEELPLAKWFELAKEPDFQIKEKGGVRNVVEP
ncbi:MAG TPA: ribosomal RNA small subunit methyltransferase A [Candidatus Caccocola faecigallinarum]|nr:ribosomal RNA small subunit methyltransferase A [Candidatus Caccocola faecigallinarum]